VYSLALAVKNMSNSVIEEISEFWLGPSLMGPAAAAGRRDWWYHGGPEVDEEIGKRFGGLVVEACNENLLDWCQTSEGSFALILLLDQFTRNLYRNTQDAYRGDVLAFKTVTEAVANSLDRPLHPVQRIWLYHPFHHSENPAEQDRGINLLHEVRNDAPEEWHSYIERSITGWSRHRDIVARFGRFPHRNHVLGRESTAEELAYLKTDGQSFGQGPQRVND